jgi:hypothetical protein
MIPPASGCHALALTLTGYAICSDRTTSVTRSSSANAASIGVGRRRTGRVTVDGHWHRAGVAKARSTLGGETLMDVAKHGSAVRTAAPHRQSFVRSIRLVDR